MNKVINIINIILTALGIIKKVVNEVDEMIDKNESGANNSQSDNGGDIEQ